MYVWDLMPLHSGDGEKDPSRMGEDWVTIGMNSMRTNCFRHLQYCCVGHFLLNRKYALP